MDAHPPESAGACDKCRGTLYVRPDDEEAVVVKRLSVFKTETLPLFDYYRDSGRLVIVDGERSEEEIFHQICERIILRVG